MLVVCCPTKVLLSSKFWYSCLSQACEMLLPVLLTPNSYLVTDCIKIFLLLVITLPARTAAACLPHVHIVNCGFQFSVNQNI